MNIYIYIYIYIFITDLFKVYLTSIIKRYTYSTVIYYIVYIIYRLYYTIEI